MSAALRARLAGRSGGSGVEVVDLEPPERVSGGFDFWVYGPSGRGSQFSAELADWAERQFRLCLEDLP